MTKKQIAINAVNALKKEYPEAICSLVYTDPLQLLIATRLAAQCTDARVNMVTPALFERFKTVDDFANSTADEVAEYIKSCGLYKTKSRDIVELAKMLRDDFGGVVPDNIDDLIKLPGIGRKTADGAVPSFPEKVKQAFDRVKTYADNNHIRIVSMCETEGLSMFEQEKFGDIDFTTSAVFGKLSDK